MVLEWMVTLPKPVAVPLASRPMPPPTPGWAPTKWFEVLFVTVVLVMVPSVPALMASPPPVAPETLSTALLF